jgi:nicotinic acid mononucleotide adenylyltransferase
VNAAKLTRQFWLAYAGSLAYRETMLAKWAPRWKDEVRPGWLRALAAGRAPRVGYIVATCSPVTKAHLALAKSAADDLGLDAIFFLLWPFHYIDGFHKSTMMQWVDENRHLQWADRLDLLTRGLRDLADERIWVLEESEAWYKQSVENYRPQDRPSVFWTGTWYLMHKLQWLVRDACGEGARFVFVCGGDQFNPNVDGLVYSAGTEQVWTDYSIPHHLAIHDLYVVPRNPEKFGPLEGFSPPFGCDHEIRIAEALPETRFSATHVRMNRFPDGYDLDDYVTPGVAVRIREKGWWGYSDLAEVRQ